MTDDSFNALLKNNNSIKNYFGNHLGILFLRVLTWFVLIIFGAIIFYIFHNGSDVISWNFLLNSPSNGGIGVAIFGTFAVSILMILFAVPIGVFSAIYLVEYAKNNLLKRIIRLAINNLAGVPSIVFGLFGLGFFVLIVGKNIDSAFSLGLIFGKPSMLWASATLAILVLPTIIVSTMEALERIPDNQRNAAFGLGATKWQVIKKIVLPQASPGILTGIILSIGRGMGEVAPVLFLGCAFFMPDLPLAYLNFGYFSIPLINPAEQFMFLAYNIFILATQSANTDITIAYQFGNVLVLVTLVLIFNITAMVFRYKFRKILNEVNN